MPVSYTHLDDPLGFTFIGNKQKLINDLLEVRFLLEPPIAAMAATRADKKDIKKITALCDEVEDLLKKHEDHTQKDIDFHAAIALSSKNVVVPRLVPVINSSIPLFVETTRGTLLEETIETHREIADAIAAHDPLRAQDAMYLHLVYNRKRIQMIGKLSLIHISIPVVIKVAAIMALIPTMDPIDRSMFPVIST